MLLGTKQKVADVTKTKNTHARSEIIKICCAAVENTLCS